MVLPCSVYLFWNLPVGQSAGAGAEHGSGALIRTAGQPKNGRTVVSKGAELETHSCRWLRWRRSLRTVQEDCFANKTKDNKG
jgi:hypothetical protein